MTRAIQKEEEEKEKIQNDVRILNERLARLDDSLARKMATKSHYDKTIKETEAAYIKVCYFCSRIELALTFVLRYLKVLKHYYMCSKERQLILAKRNENVILPLVSCNPLRKILY